MGSSRNSGGQRLVEVVVRRGAGLLVLKMRSRVTVTTAMVMMMLRRNVVISVVLLVLRLVLVVLVLLLLWMVLILLLVLLLVMVLLILLPLLPRGAESLRQRHLELLLGRLVVLRNGLIHCVVPSTQVSNTVVV